MRNDVIEASYVWTADEFLAASEVNIRRGRSPIILWAVRVLALVLAVVGFGLFGFGDKEAGLGLAFLAPAAALAWMTTGQYRGRLLRQAFHKSGAMAQPDQKITFVIDESRIRKLTAGSESSWVWELVPSVIEAPGGFLIDHGGIGHWLPNHAFFDDQDRDEFASLARRRAAKFVSRIRKGEPDPFS